MADEPPRAAPRRRALLRALLALAATEKVRLFAGMACLALSSVAGLVYPQGIRLLLDEALHANLTTAIDRAAALMIVVVAVQGAATAARYILFTTAGERIVTSLRESLYRSLLRQEIAFFDARRTGELTSRLASDTTVLQSAVSTNVSMALRAAVTVIGGLALLFYTSPLLTGLMLLVVPPVALSAVAYGRRLRKLSRDVQDALARSNEVAEESLGGIRTVRSFAAEREEERRYEAAVEASYDLARRRAWLAGGFMGATTFAAFVAVAIVLWYGARLVLNHQMTAGALTSFLVYTLLVAFSLGSLSDLYADFMRALGAAERVFELRDREPAMPPRGGDTPELVRGVVRFEGVSFAYPTRPDVTVLDHVDLELSAEQVTAAVGSSGAGKSTLAALLARLYDPRQGRVTLDGHDLRTLDPEWLRQRVGVVAQEPILFSTTILDNIRYARPSATLAEVEAAAKVANAHGFVSAFPDGYQTPVGERGVQLSGGQKQRIAIARAVLKDPKILVLDEATSALDAESEHLVKEALERLMRGRTTLVIAHRLSTVVDADRVVVLDGGRIVQSGTHEALVREDGMYRRLVEKQFVAA